MKKFGNKIRRILDVDDESFSVSLRFSDGAGGVVSLAHLFERPKGLAADILKGGMFSMCFLENGALAWPNGFELCPDALRARLTSAAKRRSQTGKPAPHQSRAAQARGQPDPSRVTMGSKVHPGVISRPQKRRRRAGVRHT